MLRFPAFCFLLVFFFCSPTFTQTRPPGFPKPPEPADKSPNTNDSSPIRRVHIDALQLEREARELLELSQSLQLDIDHVNHGLMPKDTVEKLKRIEKLSKHLRGELVQW